jgi:hypothetical protein
VIAVGWSPAGAQSALSLKLLSLMTPTIGTIGLKTSAVRDDLDYVSNAYA